MDHLHIEMLSVNTHIGVHAWEQKILQRLLIDIAIPMDFSSCDDELSQTLDYEKLCTTVTHHVEKHSFQLIERVANEVALLIKQSFQFSQPVTVTVSKPQAIKNAGNIRVTVIR